MFGIGDAVAAGIKVLDKFIPDPEAKAKAEKELRDSLQAWDAQQNATNQVEAAHRTVFVAGWRPYIGWVCGAAFTYHFVLQPVLVFGFAAAGHPVALPVFDMSVLTTVLMGMLGLGGLRTYEKIKGTAR